MWPEKWLYLRAERNQRIANWSKASLKHNIKSLASFPSLSRTPHPHLVLLTTLLLITRSPNSISKCRTNQTSKQQLNQLLPLQIVFWTILLLQTYLSSLNTYLSHYILNSFLSISATTSTCWNTPGIALTFIKPSAIISYQHQINFCLTFPHSECDLTLFPPPKTCIGHM